ncbi:hypothetical protein DF186_14465, partial [Enterococcus hirae]
MVRAEELDDGQWVLVAIGTERIRVDQWLPDDPYPLARITPWPDGDTEADGDLLVEVGRKRVVARVEALSEGRGESPLAVPLGQAISKGDRMDYA